jgi:hypothetical protein
LQNQAVKDAREMKTLFSEIHAKHINTLFGQNLEHFSVKPGGT